MKRRTPLLAGAAVTALVATSVIASPARARGVLFLTVPGNYQCVADSTSVEVEMAGANGAADGSGTNPGGFGANVGGTLTVTAGETLFITVGSAGTPAANATGGGGGGGYTSVADGSGPLVVAGGGGGGGGSSLVPVGSSASQNQSGGGILAITNCALVEQSADQVPAPWFQSYGRNQSDTCLQTWSPSWAQWPNKGTGGFTCDRWVSYNPNTGWWDPAPYAYFPIGHPYAGTSR